MKTKCVCLSRSKDKKKTVVLRAPKTFDCGVCLETKSNRSCAKLSCGHSFCRKCIAKWAKTETSCPLCRASFQSYKCGNRVFHVKQKQQKEFDHGELFELVVEATTKFLDSTDYQLQIYREFRERKSGVDVLILCIHRSLQILAEEDNRHHFEAGPLVDALRMSERLVALVRNQSPVVFV